MKNLLNLKGLCRSSQLALNPDGQTTVERRSNDGHSRRHLPVGLTKLLSLFLLLTLGVGQMWAVSTYFTNGEVLFIYTDTHNNDGGAGAWIDNSCVKMWFNNNGSGGSAASTNWLFDHDGHKMFYTIVPSANLNQVQLQRFDTKCSGNWGQSSQIKQSDRGQDAYNTFYNNNYANSFGWKNETYTMYLKGSIDSWKGNIGTFTHQSGTVFTCTFNHTATATSQEFKMYDSKKGWQTSENKSVSGMVVGATYQITATIDLSAGITKMTMSKTQLTFPITASASNGSVSPTSAFVGSSGVTFTATPNTGYHWSSWGTTSGLSATNTNPTTLTATTSGTLTANFSENTYDLIFSHNGHGTISVDGATVSSGSTASVNHFTTKALVAIPNTGYNFSGWSLTGTNTSAVTINDLTSTGASTTIKATNTGATVTASFSPKTYAITLDDDGDFQSNGSATATYNSNSLYIASHASRTDYRIEGYFAPGTGDQVTDASGNLLPNKTGNTGSGVFNITDASGNWVYDGDLTLYAHWIYDVTEYAVTFAVGTSYTSLGSLTAYNNTTSSAISSGANVRSGQSVTFTATPNTGYEVEGWYTNAACTEGKHSAGSTTYTTSIGAATNVYVKFVEKTWTVSFANDGHGTTTPSSDQTVGQLAGISISATPNTGYTFNTWTITSGSGSFTSAATTNSNTFKPTAASTITASFNETMHTITIVGGTAASTTAGVVTTGSATAADPAVGKKFTGWSLGDGVTLSGGSLTDRTINFTATANATVTATYSDRASVTMYFAKPSGWTNVYAYTWDNSNTSDHNKDYPGVQLVTTTTTNHVTYYKYQYYTEADGIGGAATGKSTWNRVIFCNGLSGGSEIKTEDLTISNGHYYFKSSEETGKAAALTSAWCIMGSFNSWSEDADQITHSSATAGSKSISLTTGSKEFKIYNIVNETWWRFAGNVTATKVATAMNNGDGNMTLTPSVAGPYTFTLGSLNGTPTLAITYPTSYTVTYKAESFYNGGASHSTATTGGTVSAVDGSDAAVASGSKVISGSTVIITASKKDGYTFDGFFTNAACTTAVSGTGVSISDNVLTFSSISDDKTVYAKFSENMTTVNLSATNGKIQYWDGDSWEDAASSVNVGVATNCSIKAVPATGYYFAGWVNTEGSDYEITGNFNVETNNNTTLKGKGTGETTGQTLTANFLELNKVYFDNSDVAWENVYVYFGGYWNDTHGACVNSAYPAVAMTNLGDGIYWAYVPREITRGVDKDNKHKIAFSSTEETIVGDNAYFTNTKAAQRDDYFYNGSLSMYRPYRAGTGDDKNSCEYYKSGYWVQYYATIGNGVEYYMKINTDDDADYEIDTLFRATAEGTNYIRKATVRLDNGNKQMNFHISTGAGSTYTTSSNITASNCTDITVKPHGGSDFTLTTTSEGIYTFYLDQSGPQMKLTAVYPASVGDYRVLYTNSSVTVPRTSDVIKTTEESSHTTTMYIDKGADGAMLKLQKCTAITAGNPVWTDAGGTGAATLLTTYASNFASAGVYKFTVNVSDDGAANAATSATCSLSEIEAYTGPYYIKTDCAPGGWANYTQNAMEQNTINAAGAGYDYYFCRWIESTRTNIKCVIATDYCDAVSDTLKTDDIINRGGNYETLPCAGSVRFSYDSKTNVLKRTYLQGANEGNSFCVLKPKEAGYVYTDAGGTTDMFASITKFKDNGNWTYQMDAYVYPGAKGGVYTDYPNSTPITRQELVDTVNNVLMGGEEKGSTRYHVRLVYDFKTDHLMSAWVAGAVDNDIDLSSDFMYIRKGQLQAEQISVASGKKITTAKKAYGVFQFSKNAMVGNMSKWNTTAYQLCKYYFSFPFDVNVSDIFGVGTFGTDWRIQKYNGAKRAEKGWFAGDGTTTFWEDVTIDSVLHAYEGYLLMLNRINFNDGSNGVWTNIGSGGSTYLYFPSKDDIGIVAKGTTTVKVPSHECKINRYFTQDLNPDGTHKAGARNHMITDSHWNMLGVPLFADTTGGDFTSTFNTVYDASKCGYLYTWDAATNSLSIADTKSFTFNAMYAYMVQYTGDITFNGSVISPSLAARRAEKKKEYTIDLNLTKDDLLAGHTYVELREEADNLFMLNEDMYMVKDSKTADVYTFAGCYDVSANVLSVENHVIPVGVNVKSAGTYTFSMPSNFDGTVTLIDNFTQTRTNLAIEDYEVSLPKGEINDRFLLEINIRQVPTAIDGVEGGSLKDGKAHKYIENGAMYILRDGKIYDARGNKVK
ncbi:MAG: starch-binding protein [Paludibacteraceae bacterium]|nr:starch-binding protein [Paludibacteraceae bacterium]